MTKQLFKDAFGWGVALWFVGYLLGMVLFMLVPPSFIGWVITPIGTTISLWVLFKKVKGSSMQYFLIVAVVWTVLAIAGDYFFIMKLLKPADGYYKPDVYLYYTLTFVLPLLAGWKRQRPR